MSENSEISWTHHTFNPWSGCVKVSPACTNCYAANLPPSMRRGAEWGADTPRVPASESYWQGPIAWDRKAAKAGERHRVFCASTADVFEARADLDPARARLFRLIENTPNLDWLLLTKRPDHMAEWFRAQVGGFRWPANAWAGATVEDQRRADERIPHLLRVPARVRFLSMEPLLGAVEFSDVTRRSDAVEQLGRKALDGISWVIAGGESGPRARPSHPDWFRSLRDQCVAAGVRFHFKQIGAWRPFYDRDVDDPDWQNVPAESDDVTRINLAGGRGFHGERVVYFQKVGAKNAGRLLDGRTWDEVPA